MSTEEVWFLTIVYRGRVTLTSIVASSIDDANEQAYEEFVRMLGYSIAYEMMTDATKSDMSHLITWHFADDGVTATLIKA